MKLIIVESPTKVKSFRKIFKDQKDLEIFATKGHIRDLPKNKLGIKIENSFQPEYTIVKEKKDVIDQLKKLGKKADQVILATDPDREGESIAYHTAYYLGYIDENWPEFKIKDPEKIKRIIFYEITENELKNALKNPSEIRESLVKAQATRRLLDRLVGYKLSPLLWKKIGKRWLSAGRVQTVALRLIVEREKEIENFQKEPFYSVSAEFAKDSVKFQAVLKKLQEKEVEIKTKISLFAGEYTYTKTIINDQNKKSIEERLQNQIYKIQKIEKKKTFRQPPPPMNTSLLQQEANRSLRYSTKYTMKLAQNLYEQGLITYHRTDSFNLSKQFLKNARKFIEKNFGQKYLNPDTRIYKTRSRSAQEAHEAIRPTDLRKTPDNIKLSPSHKKIYALIYNRALATQFSPAQIDILKIYITTPEKDLFLTRQEKISFLGFLKIFGYTLDKGNFLDLEEGQNLELKKLLFEKKTTQPPPRYTEARLIRTMEEKGIGRPSTYAPIVSLIQEKRYAEKEDGQFRPTILGKAICGYLIEKFPDIFELGFTARMEEKLDEIANKNQDLVKVLQEFYLPLEKDLKKTEKETGYINVQEKIDKKCPKCGRDLLIRFSRFGRFIGCSGYPECKYIENFKNFAENAICPKCGGKILIKRTKRGKRFYGCENYPKCDFASWKLPKTKENNEN